MVGLLWGRLFGERRQSLRSAVSADVMGCFRTQWLGREQGDFPLVATAEVADPRRNRFEAHLRRLLLGRSGLGKFWPDLAPVLTHVLPGDGPARLSLNCDTELFASGSLPVHDVSKEGPRRPTAGGEGLSLFGRHGLDEGFELVHAAKVHQTVNAINTFRGIHRLVSACCNPAHD